MGFVCLLFGCLMCHWDFGFSGVSFVFGLWMVTCACAFVSCLVTVYFVDKVCYKFGDYVCYFVGFSG